MAGKFCASRKRVHKKRNAKKRYTAIILVALLLVAGAAGLVAAKYVSNNTKEAEVHASNFHFSSDYLKPDQKAPQYTVSDWGSHNVVLHLFNYEQENVSLVSDSEIRYKIAVSNDWSVTVTENGADVTPNAGVYTMPQGVSTHRVELSYTGNKEQPDDLSVTVESVKPYKKTLEAEFQFSTKNGLEYTVEDKGNYEIVTIYTNDYYGTVKVSWIPEKHSPDNTCEYMGTWWDGNPVGELVVTEYTTYTLIFVENQPGSYDADDFEIAGA